MALRCEKTSNWTRIPSPVSLLGVVAAMVTGSLLASPKGLASEGPAVSREELTTDAVSLVETEQKEAAPLPLVLADPASLVPYHLREVSHWESDLEVDSQRSLGQAIAAEIEAEESHFVLADVAGPDTLALSPESSDGVAAVYEDLSIDVLGASMEQFREMLRLPNEGVRFDPRYVASLISDPRNLEPVREWQANGRGEPGPSRFRSDKIYTVLGGRVVEFIPDSPLETSREGLAANSPLMMQILPGESESLAEATSSLDLAMPGLGILDSNRVQGQASASYLSGPIGTGGSYGGTLPAEGVYLKGRVELPAGVNATTLVVRLAGTGVQAIPDKQGFFEIGPLSEGSSFHLLLFDESSKLNRRLVPIHLSAREADSEIRLIGSSDVYRLAESFGRSQAAIKAGFCGNVLLPAEGNPETVQVELLDALGQRSRLGFYSALGLPSSATRLSRDGRFCAFDLGPGSYRLLVTAPGLRRSFDLDLERTIFENSRVFDTAPTRYLRVSGNIPVDVSLQQQLQLEEGLASLPFDHPLDDRWLDGEGPVVWTPVTDFLLNTDRAYASVAVQSDEDRFYFPASEEWVIVREESSGSFEIVGQSRILSAATENSPLRVHWLGRDTARRLRSKLELGDLDRDFVFYAELDTAVFMSSKGPYEMRVSDLWTGQPKGRLLRLSDPDTRILRFAGGELPTGVYTLAVYSTKGKLVWTGVVRSEPGASQVLTNRP